MKIYSYDEIGLWFLFEEEMKEYIVDSTIADWPAVADEGVLYEQTYQTRNSDKNVR